MDRRTLLSALGGAAAVGSLAPAGGCLGVLGRNDGGRPAPPPAVADPPRAVYRPTHAPRVFRIGAADVGDYRVALLATLPVRFWTVSGTRRTRHAPGSDRTLHLMAAVWDARTGTALPEAGATVELAGDGGFVAEEVVYPMIGQGSGFHYGDNFALPGSGTYRIRLGVAPLALRLTGAFAGRFEAGGTTTVEFDFEADRVREASYRRVDGAGDPGAVELGPLAHPAGRAPRVGDLPGRVLGATTIDGARYVATLLASPPAGVDPGAADGDGVAGGAEAYLAVSARTPYNRIALPTMGLRVRVDRDGERLLAGRTERTLDPDLGYHYGRTVPPLRAGDELALRVTVPPQVARHEGYETAFLRTATGSIELPPADGA